MIVVGNCLNVLTLGLAILKAVPSFLHTVSLHDTTLFMAHRVYPIRLWIMMQYMLVAHTSHLNK